MQEHLAVAGVDVAESKAADDCRLLGVEQDEEPGEPVPGIEGIVVEEPPDLVPAGLGVEGAGGPFQRVAGNSTLVCLRSRAQRTKCPVAPLRAVLAVAIQASRSPWAQVARVRPRAASQSGNAMAAVMWRRVVYAWLCVAGVPRSRCRSRRSTCQTA